MLLKTTGVGLILLLLLSITSVMFVVGSNRTLRRVLEFPFLLVSARLCAYSCTPLTWPGRRGVRVGWGVGRGYERLFAFVSWPSIVYIAIVNTLLMLRCRRSLAIFDRLLMLCCGSSLAISITLLTLHCGKSLAISNCS